jgi:hypothetical protein
LHMGDAFWLGAGSRNAVQGPTDLELGLSG